MTPTPMGTAQVHGSDGGHVIGMAGEILTLVLPRAFAPGAPLRGTVTLPERAIGIEGRTVGSRKTPDGTFEVRVRLVNLKRDDRLRLSTPA